MKNKLTDLWGNRSSQNDFINAFCEIRSDPGKFIDIESMEKYRSECNAKQDDREFLVRQMVSGYHQPSKGEQIIFLNCPDWYHTSPDSGERHYQSRT